MLNWSPGFLYLNTIKNHVWEYGMSGIDPQDWDAWRASIQWSLVLRSYRFKPHDIGHRQHPHLKIGIDRYISNNLLSAQDKLHTLLTVTDFSSGPIVTISGKKKLSGPDHQLHSVFPFSMFSGRCSCYFKFSKIASRIESDRTVPLKLHSGE